MAGGEEGSTEDSLKNSSGYFSDEIFRMTSVELRVTFSCGVVRAEAVGVRRAE